MKDTDIAVTHAELSFVPVQTRVPLKFGAETLTTVTVARVRVTVETRSGTSGTGWGETSLSVQWVWAGTEPYSARHRALCELSAVIMDRTPGISPSDFGA